MAPRNDLDALRRLAAPGGGELSAPNVITRLCDEVELLRGQRSCAWVTLALGAGVQREMIVSPAPAGRWKARLEFADLGTFIAADGETPLAAIAALDAALQEDAAAAMVRAGVV